MVSDLRQFEVYLGGGNCAQIRMQTYELYIQVFWQSRDLNPSKVFHG